MGDVILGIVNQTQSFLDAVSAIPLFYVPIHVVIATLFSRLTFGFFANIPTSTKQLMEVLSWSLNIKKEGIFREYRKYAWIYSLVAGLLVTVILYFQFEKGSFAWAIVYSLLGPAAVKDHLVGPLIKKDFALAAGPVSDKIRTVTTEENATYADFKGTVVEEEYKDEIAKKSNSL
jgi:hypothetical protein